jgi:hypothetical protein
MNKRVGTSLVALLVVVGGAAGCGDSGEDAAATTTTGAAPSTSSTTASNATTASSTAPAGKVTLIDVGVDLPTGVVEFGDPMDAAVSKLTAALGKPAEDTGLGEPRRPYGRCPGTKVRALRYHGGALELLFGDSGTKAKGMVFHSWVLTSEGQPRSTPRASVLIGDVTTFDFGVGTTVKQFERGLGDPGGYSFETFDSADGPTFVVANEEAGNDPPPGSPEAIRGTLSSEEDAGTATLVEGGAGCSE